MSLPRSLLSRSALLLLPVLLGALPARASAQASTLIYGMNETGTITVNGTVLNKLPASSSNVFQAWRNLVVVGADRYALRVDGNLYKNGSSLYKLPFGVTATPNGSFIFAWIALAHGASGIYALREDGLLTRDGVALVNLPEGNFVFTACVAVDIDDTTSDIYCLRSDGAVYKNTLTVTPDHKFTGGPGLHVFGSSSSNTAADGAGTETVWVDIAWDPQTSTLRGLRRDGKVSSGAEVASPGPQPLDPDLMALPFPPTFSGVDSEAEQNANRYRSLRFTDSGTWHAVRGNGQIYTQASLVVPLVDLPGEAGALNDTYVTVATLGEDFWTIRWNGKVHAGLDVDEVLNLTSERYRCIAVSDVAPDLSNFKNPAPLLSTYTVTVVEGDDVTVPVYAIDIEKTGDDLVVTQIVNEKKPLPEGLVFDASNDDDPDTLPSISWSEAVGKGTYTVALQVDDGVNKPKKYSYKIKVILPDAKPEKNKKPVFSKVKNTQALVGFPYQLQILATDADPGDPVTLEADETKGPFVIEESDAEFNDATGLFTWKPTFNDIGKHKVKFTATDGLGAKATYTVTITVVSGFATAP